MTQREMIQLGALEAEEAQPMLMRLLRKGICAVGLDRYRTHVVWYGDEGLAAARFTKKEARALIRELQGIVAAMVETES